MNPVIRLATLFILSACLSAPVGAQECVVQKSKDILDCALKRHPDVMQAESIQRRDEALVQIARQRPNPELEGKIVKGTNGDASGLNTETTLLHTVETGGKRRARIFQAEAQVMTADAGARRAREETVLKIVLAAYRLRQIKTERGLISENRETFQRIVVHHRSRKLLSPEQQVSLAVFESGKRELILKQAVLGEEESSLRMELVAATGIPSRILEKHLPGPKKTWPTFRDDTAPKGAPSLAQEAAAELEMARANVKLAKSTAWPDFRLGPTVETDRAARDTTVKAGASLEIPLPIFNRNRGGQTYARLDEQRARLRYDAILKKAAGERVFQLGRYRSSLKAWRSSRATSQSSQSHHEVDELFERGLVTSSLMMEAHRQNLSLAELRHAQELAALESYWKLLILDGRLEEGTL